MSQFLLSTPNGSTSHFDPEKLLEDVDQSLKSGSEFVVQVAQSATCILTQINGLLREHGIEVTLDAHSDPEASDYIVNAALGGALGAAGGVGAGAALWGIARVAAAATPIGPFLLVGGLLGFAVGATTGVAVTHWGLKIRFSRVQGRVEMAFRPIS